jgi:hypothetical protein
MISGRGYQNTWRKTCPQSHFDHHRSPLEQNPSIPSGKLVSGHLSCDTAIMKLSVEHMWFGMKLLFDHMFLSP